MQPLASFSVANINPGTVRTEFMRSIMALVEHERQLQRTTDSPRIQFDQFMDRISGPYLDDERNHCCEWFLDNTTSDYLVFQDSDVTGHPADFFRLVATAHDRDIKLLSGVYYNAYAPHGVLPVVYKWIESEDGQELVKYTREELQKYIEQYPGEPMLVDSVGAGFLCIHRDLLVTLRDTWGRPTPYFAEPNAGGVHYGEDHGLCFRANHVGHPPHVIPDLEVDHFKTSIIRAGAPAHTS